MATYGRRHSILVSETIAILRDQVRRDMFDGNESPTRIRAYALSGTLDEFTEEVTYFATHNWQNASGILHTIGEKDELLGLGGKIRVGDSSVLYHYDAVSGIAQNQTLHEIEILTPAISGLYYVLGQKWSVIGGNPMFLKVAIAKDPR